MIFLYFLAGSRVKDYFHLERITEIQVPWQRLYFLPLPSPTKRSYGLMLRPKRIGLFVHAFGLVLAEDFALYIIKDILSTMTIFKLDR